VIRIEQRVIFDTTIFGILAKEENSGEIQLKIKEDSDFKVFGVNAIRREIKNVNWESKQIQKIILKIYEFLTEKEYPVDQSIEELAKKYFYKYQEFGGKKDYQILKTDLLIVATATMKNMDIVVSSDRETMSKDHKAGEKFRKAYREINAVERYNNPDFWQYKELKLRFGFFKKQP